MPRYEIRNTSTNARTYVDAALPIDPMLYVPVAGTYRSAAIGPEATTDQVVPTLTVSVVQTSPAVGSTVTGTTNAPSGMTWQGRRNGTQVTTGVVGTDPLQIATTGYTAGDTMTFRVFASGAQDVTSAGVNLVSASLPLDGFTGIQFALSPARRLLTSYTGALIRVRRSSDNTEQDIGYDGSGNLDTTALLTFVGSGDGFIRTLYGQSSSRDFVMNTNANQPRIVSAGVVDTLGGRPTMVFDGTNDRLEWVPSSTTLTVNTVSAVALRSSSSTSTGILFEVSNNGGGARIRVNHAADGGGGTRIFEKGGQNVGTGSWTKNVLERSTAVGVDAGNSRLFVNGTQNNATTSWGTGTTTTGTNGARIGATTGAVGSYWFGSISEIVAFDTSLSTSDRTTLDNNQSAYYV